jgi:hypothetical protein
MGPFMSFCLSRFSQEIGIPHDPGSLLENTAATIVTEVIVGEYC